MCPCFFEIINDSNFIISMVFYYINLCIFGEIKMLTESTILITGGTGSFGKKFLEMIFEKYQPKKVIIYSRDEFKQSVMQTEYRNKVDMSQCTRM